MVRNILMDLEILECDEDYEINKKAKWYRLGSRCLGCRLVSVKVSTRLSSRLAKIRGDRSERGDLTPEVEHLGRWLRELRVDEELARPWVCRPRCLKQRLTRVKVDLIQSGKACPIRDRYGRVHSPLTNLRRQLRPALRIHGQELIEIDVSNSQPLILGFMGAKILAGDWSLEDVKQLGSAGSIREPFANLPMVPCGGELPADANDFLDVCQTGRFYETVAELWEPLRQSPIAKIAIKRLSFKYLLFGPVRRGNVFWEAFNERWPSMARILEALKHGDHGRTSRASQRIESHLLIEGVVGQFLLYHPRVPIQTIHDSVLVTVEAAEIAVSAIHAQFDRIGLKPHIKQKKRQEAEQGTTQKRRSKEKTHQEQRPYLVSSQIAPIKD